MRSKKWSTRTLVAIVLLIVTVIRFVASLGYGFRRDNFRRRWNTAHKRAIAARRHVARWWSLRATVAKEMDRLEARFNDYFKELVAHLLPHDRDLVQSHYQETELLIRRARIQRRLGRYGTARKLVNSADFCINRACSQLCSNWQRPTDRLVVWSEIWYP
jgi:hypothetical protein